MSNYNAVGVSILVGLGLDELRVKSAPQSGIADTLRYLERERLSDNSVCPVRYCGANPAALKTLPMPDIHSGEDS
jgi:hypothetical protein